MPNVRANGIDVEYDSFGEAGRPALLLIHGLGAQMTGWRREFCEQLAARGFFVIRFDNRDIGLSTKFHSFGVPNLMQVMAARMRGETVAVPYTLWDMADDSVGLLDALSLDAAHIAGASMGGMIAQAVAIRHPRRVLSLTSIMSTTGEADLPPAEPAAMEALLRPRPAEKAAYIEHALATAKVIGGPGFPLDDAAHRRLSAETFDRSHYWDGISRQILAVGATGGRREALRSVQAPTVVIHGATDPLVPLSGGIDTYKAVPGAELVTIEGMGHSMPEGAWPQIIDAIERVASRAAAIA